MNYREVADMGVECASREIAQLRAENERAKALLARAHGMLEGHSRHLVHEIATFLGWTCQSEGDPRG